MVLHHTLKETQKTKIKKIKPDYLQEVDLTNSENYSGTKEEPFTVPYFKGFRNYCYKSQGSLFSWMLPTCVIHFPAFTEVHYLLHSVVYKPVSLESGKQDPSQKGGS